MGRKFDVEWDDFSGGYWLGTNKLSQPRNTWQGDDIIVAYQDGTLKVGARPVDVGAVTAWRYAAARVPDPLAGAVDSVWYEDVSPFTSKVLKVNGTTIATLTGTINGYHAKRLTFYAGNRYVFGAYTDTGVPKIAVVNYNANTHTTHNVNVEFGQLHTFGDFIVAAYFNRLYYSAPGDPTSWSSADYYDIGDSTITAFCNTPSGLLIGTSSGWWMGSGVLGDTFTLRQANNTSAPIFPGSAIDSSLGVLFKASDGLWALNGTQSAPVVYLDPSGFGFARQAGPDFVGMSCSDGALLYSEATRQWRKITHPDGDLEPYEGFCSETTLRFFNQSLTGQECTYDHSPAGICTDGTAFAQGTVTLAEFESRVPFTVTELLVEVDLGDSSNNYTRSIGCELVGPSRPLDYGGDLSAVGYSSQPQTQVLPAMAATSGEKFMARFGQDMFGTSFAFQPRLSLQGVKVRRVIARCEERG
jgi:hypothetical protein